MLTGLEVKNFKCFGEDGIRLDLAPFTILVGPNGSGKTSALDAIALLAQSAPSPGEGTGFKWQGPWVDFGPDGTLAFHRGKTTSKLTLALTFHAGESFNRWQTELGRFPTLKVSAKRVGYHIEHSPGTNEWLHRITLDGVVAATNETKRGIRNRTAHYEESLQYPAVRVTYSPEASANRVLFPPLFSGRPNGTIEQSVDEKVRSDAAQLGHLVEYMASRLREGVFLVGPDRLPRRVHPKVNVTSQAVGRHGDDTLVVLSIIFAQPEHKGRAELIRRWAAAFGLNDLAGGYVGAENLRAAFYDSDSDAYLPTAFAGFGSQQILPVITQLFAAPADSLVMVEEPEISLHPRAQVDLVKMFAEAVKMGQQVIVTTHSPTLLLALRELANNGIRTADVAIYHFAPAQGGPKISRLELEDTWYVRDWVPSFAEVESRLIKEWIGSVGANIRGE
jgi:predicted ATPase